MNNENLVKFWLPIILAVTSLLGTVLVTYHPELGDWIRGAPKLQTLDKSPTTAALPDTDCTAMSDGRQICYGTALLDNTGSHVRAFSFKFAKPFLRQPVVATSLNVQSSGYAFAIFDSKLSESNYVGSVVEVQFRANSSPVIMSYVAIGSPGK